MQDLFFFVVHKAVKAFLRWKSRNGQESLELKSRRKNNLLPSCALKRDSVEEFTKMKRLVSLILIVNVYLGLIAPVGMQLNLKANAQTVRGKTKTTNMNLNLSNGLQFRLSEG